MDSMIMRCASVCNRRAANNKEFDVEDDPLAREVDTRVLGKTKFNPANRARVATRSRSGGANMINTVSKSSGGRVLHPRIDHGGVHQPSLGALTAKSAEDPSNRRAALKDDPVEWPLHVTCTPMTYVRGSPRGPSQ